ncbi:hypothetical protein M422DRAFT_206754 [Sphaerobolus stellatus SS14]|uniref:Cas1p 10 TM acyl transferase domain-containing protein n=1 Tax=Sphaerobolus stellatus (strain SS14) TaxID=990650 RepID=A0A0C9VSP3_SPHS4|nr:hypothetical protein M422DRAFT_206754 [Sphaerobolus stellatus SS14]
MAPSKRFSWSFDPLLPHWMAAGAVAVTLLAGLFRYVFIDWSDPLRCNALLQEGQWLDDKFSNWQPEGCMLNNYNEKDISTCLASRRVVFVGDSVTRQLFFAVAHAADKELPSQPPSNEQKHSDYNLTSKYNTEFSFIWDPYLNTTRTQDLLRLTDVASMTVSSTSTVSTPAMLVIGSGLWYLRYGGPDGLPRWEGAMEDALEKVMAHGDSLADTVVFLPVESIVSSKLTPERAETMRMTDIDAMNSDLRHRIHPPPTGYLPPPLQVLRTDTQTPHTAFPEAFLAMLDPSESIDGLHYSDKITKAQANILFNYRCNEVLPKKFPLDKTCCRSYPSPTFYQILLIGILISWGFIAKYYAAELARMPKLHAFFPAEDHIMPLSIFGFTVFLMYIADRTPIWDKEQKQFDAWIFGGWMLFTLAIGLFTTKRGDKDLGFLNREQTDEWKGWMQIAILIYHYYGASKISGIYNPIRVLVAAYLFMTGYGHATFYMKKADFGFKRIAQVMVRLNLLPIALAYVMDTDYISYYFSPLVSMWFMIIYFTMAIGKNYNENTVFVVFKIFFSMAAVTLFFSYDWILEEVFLWLDRLCSIHWSAKEWAFRAKLDLWIVYAGMLTALLYMKFREARLIEHPYWPMVYKVSLVLSGAIMLWYFGFELSQPSKFAYNAWHPYVSFLPIGAFVILRNANPVLRSASSRVFAFIGTCSLETFIIQFHFWLAADTKGILLVIPGTKWRPINLIVSSVMFIWVSHKMAKATGDLTNWICGASKKTLPTTVTTATTSRVPQTASRAASQPEEIPLTEPGKNEEQTEDGGTIPHSQRWVDRLADGNRSPARPGFRIFADEGSSWSSNWTPSLAVKITIGGVIMWLLNITWPH